MSLPIPNDGIGDDGVTVYAAVAACLVHIVMVDR